jgi:hypothetical protein
MAPTQRNVARGQSNVTLGPLIVQGDAL